MNVAIIGRPNVGKSALFNRLAGRKTAIVHDQPGITRDRLSASCRRGARPFTIFDTGGIAGAGESELIRDVQRVVGETIRESDILLLVVDGRAGLTPMDQEIARIARKSAKPVVLVINKIDHDKNEDLAADFDSLGFDQSVSISAEHNRGTGELLEQIEQFLPEISDQGSGISDALSIAIVGRPNVGKSSLINSILEQPRAIVSEIAGTTRDAIDISYQRGADKFVFIDTAGIRRRSKHSSSAEVFSVMRAEKSVRRADLCVLIIDLVAGVTAQDKRIGGLIQEADRPCIVVLNKWDLVRPRPQSLRDSVAGRPHRRKTGAIQKVMEQARDNLFFLDYAPILVASALTGENVDRVFRLIDKVRSAARRRIGTGVLNRLLRAAFAANPPPLRKGKRLKLLYATQSSGKPDRFKPSNFQSRQLSPAEFVLFVNDPRLLTDHYERYLIAKIREAEPYPGLPVILRLRERTGR